MFKNIGINVQCADTQYGYNYLTFNGKLERNFLKGFFRDSSYFEKKILCAVAKLSRIRFFTLEK